MHQAIPQSPVENPGVSPYLDALADLQTSDISLVNGFSNHAPMVVEALFNLGAREEIAGWMARTASTRRRREPDTGEAVAAPQIGEWAHYDAFRRQAVAELSRQPWRSVLRAWSARLAPGYAGAALHGVIRVGHAARGLQRLDHPHTRAELASALAYWAVAYGELPLQPAAPDTTPTRSVHDAWKALKPVPEDKRRNDGSIVTAVQQVRYAEGLSDILSQIAWPDDPVESTRVVARVFLDMFLVSARTRLTALVLTHALTGLAASWTIGRATDPSLHHALVREAFKAGAALHLAYSPFDDKAGLPDMGGRIDREALIAGAFRTDDDHAIKLTDACLTLEAICEDDGFRAAARLGQNLMS